MSTTSRQELLARKLLGHALLCCGSVNTTAPCCVAPKSMRRAKAALLQVLLPAGACAPPQAACATSASECDAVRSILLGCLATMLAEHTQQAAFDRMQGFSDDSQAPMERDHSSSCMHERSCQSNDKPVTGAVGTATQAAAVADMTSWMVGGLLDALRPPAGPTAHTHVHTFSAAPPSAARRGMQHGCCRPPHHQPLHNSQQPRVQDARAASQGPATSEGSNVSATTGGRAAAAAPGSANNNNTGFGFGACTCCGTGHSSGSGVGFDDQEVDSAESAAARRAAHAPRRDGGRAEGEEEGELRHVHKLWWHLLTCDGGACKYAVCRSARRLMLHRLTCDQGPHCALCHQLFPQATTDASPAGAAAAAAGDQAVRPSVRPVGDQAVQPAGCQAVLSRAHSEEQQHGQNLPSQERGKRRRTSDAAANSV